MESGSKVISFRLPADLAGEFERYCQEAVETSGEVLRRLVDEMLYPGSDREAELDSPEQIYGVKATAWIADQVNIQIKAQLVDQLGDLVDEHLELVQVDQALTEAEKEHYNGTLASHGRELADLGRKFARLQAEVDPILTGLAMREVAARMDKKE